ncbi:hypothetical protein BLA29_015087 [Euroglyphus maynei]|uniref:Uncharacterized protein n=1 Tax=Euroglyphus maynei TaxID=6958 RepID=A0A1Y3ATH5_EURMA|nr:hypothetical protein BLA29_015087 [Euroglyphus maynei]
MNQRKLMLKKKNRRNWKFKNPKQQKMKQKKLKFKN